MQFFFPLGNLITIMFTKEQSLSWNELKVHISIWDDLRKVVQRFSKYFFDVVLLGLQKMRITDTSAGVKITSDITREPPEE